MSSVDRLSSLLSGEAAEALNACRDRLKEIRLRAGRPVELVGTDFESFAGGLLQPEKLRQILSSLMEHSLYARQQELDRGYFTLEDGSRAGVCGRVFLDGGRCRMGEVGSACIRVARALPGCADGIMPRILGPEGVRSTLLISPPGMGKTTLLRDIARQLSDHGYRVCIADERHELAACHLGQPTMDVGMRTDVMDGGLRIETIGWMLRSMAPEVIVADEIGGEGDAVTLDEAVRCGVSVIASAHASGLRDALCRRSLQEILDSGAIRRVALLGPRPGAVETVWHRDGTEKGESAWRRE